MTVTLALLGLIGVLVALHAICLATDIPEGTPLIFGLAVSIMAAAGIGTTVFAIAENMLVSSYALFVAIGAQASYMAEAWRRGYTVVGPIVIKYQAKQ